MKNKLMFICDIISIALYLAIGVLIFKFKDTELAIDGTLLGIMAVVNSFSFFVKGVIHKEKVLKNVITSSIYLIFAILFICLSEIDVYIFCITWACFEILSGANEIYSGIKLFKEPLTKILNITFGVVEIFLGILLVIEKEDSIYAHIIILAIACLVNALLESFETVERLKNKSNA